MVLRRSVCCGTTRCAAACDADRRRHRKPVHAAGKPEPGFGSFVGERRLTDEQIATLRAWVAGGMEGREALPDASPPVPQWTAGWQLGKPDLVVTLPEYTLRAGRPRRLPQFRRVDSGLRDALRPRIGVPRRLGGDSPREHPRRSHAGLAAAGRPRSSTRGNEGADPELRRLSGRALSRLDAWTVRAARAKGACVAADRRIRLRRSAHMRPTGKPERIQPALGLFFTDDAPTQLPAMLRLGRQDIDIPAGESDYRSTDAYTLPVDVQVEAIQPHSHYRATQVKAWAVLPDATTRWLMFIPRWDFAWQDVSRRASVLAAGRHTVAHRVHLRQLGAESAESRHAAPACACGASSRPTKWATSGFR